MSGLVLQWGSLVEELLAAGSITKAQAESCSYLNLVGNVGSIDNDMVCTNGRVFGVCMCVCV